MLNRRDEFPKLICDPLVKYSPTSQARLMLPEAVTSKIRASCTFP